MLLATVKSAIEVLDRVLQVLALAAQPFFEDADVSRPESAGREELASGRQRNGEIQRRKRVQRDKAHKDEDQHCARALSSAIEGDVDDRLGRALRRLRQRGVEELVTGAEG